MKLLLHQSTQQQLEALRKSSGGSYLFTGPDAVGKFTAAKSLANLFCLNKGDIIVIEAAKPSIGIEQIAQLRVQLQLKVAKASAQRYVIIRDAERLTREAQNAFLKTLEEPPLTTTIILTTASPHGLALTILSRVQKINFPLINSKLLTQHLVQQLTLPFEIAQRLANFASGAVGTAISLHEHPDQLENLQLIHHQAKEFVTQPLFQKLLLIQQTLDKIEPKVLITTVASVLRSHLRLAVKNSNLHLAKKLSRQLRAIEQSLHYLGHNGNGKLALESLALQLT